jgi:hypothetical protein
MAKILCVLYDDPEDGYPTSYPSPARNPKVLTRGPVWYVPPGSRQSRFAPFTTSPACPRRLAGC